METNTQVELFHATLDYYDTFQELWDAIKSKTNDFLLVDSKKQARISITYYQGRSDRKNTRVFWYKKSKKCAFVLHETIKTN